MGSRKKQGKRRRPDGAKAPTPRQAVRAAKEDLYRRQQEWLARLASNPASFAEVEREVHAQMRRHADVLVAGLLAKASEQPEMEQQAREVLENAEVELRAPEKKSGR